MRFTNLAAIVIALLATSAKAADEPLRFTIDEYGWELEQTPDRCTAIAQFNAGDRQAVLQLIRITPASFFDVRLIGTGLRPVGTDPRITVSPSTPDLAAALLQPLASENVGGAAFTLHLPSHDPEPGRSPAEAQNAAEQVAADIEYIQIEDLFTESVLLETGGSEGFLPALNRCTNALVSSWGLDPDQQRNLSRSPTITDPQAQGRAAPFFRGPQTPRPYTAQLIILVDEAGRVTDCKTVPADAPLDKVAGCRQLKREVRFKPALDASGQPIASYANSVIMF